MSEVKRPTWTLCPICRIRSGVRSDFKSTATADFFECDNCGHEWHAPKSQPQ
jgi:hypothetical protein